MVELREVGGHRGFELCVTGCKAAAAFASRFFVCTDNGPLFVPRSSHGLRDTFAKTRQVLCCSSQLDKMTVWSTLAFGRTQPHMQALEIEARGVACNTSLL